MLGGRFARVQNKKTRAHHKWTINNIVLCQRSTQPNNSQATECLLALFRECSLPTWGTHTHTHEKNDTKNWVMCCRDFVAVFVAWWKPQQQTHTKNALCFSMIYAYVSGLSVCVSVLCVWWVWECIAKIRKQSVRKIPTSFRIGLETQYDERARSSYEGLHCFLICSELAFFFASQASCFMNNDCWMYGWVCAAIS